MGKVRRRPLGVNVPSHPCNYHKPMNTTNKASNVALTPSLSDPTRSDNIYTYIKCDHFSSTRGRRVIGRWGRGWGRRWRIWRPRRRRCCYCCASGSTESSRTPPTIATRQAITSPFTSTRLALSIIPGAASFLLSSQISPRSSPNRLICGIVCDFR